jgi:hypothetical protein
MVDVDVDVNVKDKIGKAVKFEKNKCVEKILQKQKQINFKNDLSNKIEPEHINLLKTYEIIAEPDKTTIKIDQDTDITIDKNIGEITKQILLDKKIIGGNSENNNKKIIGGNSENNNKKIIGGNNDEHSEIAANLEQKYCDKQLSELDDQLKQIKNKRPKIDDIQLMRVNIPNDKLKIKATNQKTEIIYADNNQKIFDKNIGMMIDQLNQTKVTKLLNKVTSSSEGGKYTKKTFRYPTKRNKLGRFVKGKTRKSNK